MKGPKNLMIFFLLQIPFTVYSQGIGIGTNTPNSSAILDLVSPNKGILIPRMNNLAMESIVLPARGLMIYDSAVNQLMINKGTPADPDWQPLAGGTGWALSGNLGTDSSAHFIGNIDNHSLKFRINILQVCNKWGF